MHARPVEILLVEDSPADARLAKTALLEGMVPKRLHVAADGVQAIDFVRSRSRYQDAPRPDVVLLDLNLPKRDGLEVLREIKSDPELRSITVVVLTTSQLVDDVRSAYDLAANCYVVKPVDLDEFMRVMRGIEEFWMRVATLPTIGRDPHQITGAGSRRNENGDPKKGSASAGARYALRKARGVRRRVPVFRKSRRAAF